MIITVVLTISEWEAASLVMSCPEKKNLLFTFGKSDLEPRAFEGKICGSPGRVGVLPKEKLFRNRMVRSLQCWYQITDITKDLDHNIVASKSSVRRP